MVLLKKEMHKGFRDSPLLRVVKPQKLILNPAGFVNTDSAIHSDTYVAVYYRNYFVRIEHGKSLFGPHKYELFFQVRRGLRVWLGTCIHRHVFFSERDVQKKLRRNIHLQKYYCSPSSAEEVVELEFDPDKEIDIR